MKRKYSKSDFKPIQRVFTDTVVNMWSVDYCDGKYADYKHFGDMPKTCQAFVEYVTTSNDTSCKIIVNGVTTNYVMKG